MKWIPSYFGRMDRSNRAVGWSLVAVIGAFVVQGCSSPMVRQQRLVSKSNMVFSDSMLFAYGSRIGTQLEPGASVSGGAQNSGCSSCR